MMILNAYDHLVIISGDNHFKPFISRLYTPINTLITNKIQRY